MQLAVQIVLLVTAKVLNMSGSVEGVSAACRDVLEVSADVTAI